MEQDRIRLLFELDRYEEVVTVLASIPAGEDAKLNYWIKSASLNHLERDEQALKVACEGVAKYPDYYPLHQIVAHLYLNFGQLSKSLVEIKKALKLSPESAESHILAGYIFLQMDDHAKAEKYSDAALEYEPENVEALNLKAFLLYYHDDEDGARKLLAEALRIEPRNAAILKQLAVFSSGRREKVDFLRKSLAILPTDTNSQDELQYEESGKDKIRLFAYLLLLVMVLGMPHVPEGCRDQFLGAAIAISVPFLIYLAKDFLLLVSIIFLSFVAVGAAYEDFFALSSNGEQILTNIMGIVVLFVVSLMVAYVLLLGRAIFTIPLISLKEHYEHYRNSLTLGTTTSFFKERLLTRKFIFYLIGTLVIPGVNIYTYIFSLDQFWLSYLLSYPVLAFSCSFFGRFRKMSNVMLGLFIYGLAVSGTSLFVAMLFPLLSLKIIAIVIVSYTVTAMLHRIGR